MKQGDRNRISILYVYLIISEQCRANLKFAAVILGTGIFVLQPPTDVRAISRFSIHLQQKVDYEYIAADKAVIRIGYHKKAAAVVHCAQDFLWLHDLFLSLSFNYICLCLCDKRLSGCTCIKKS